MKIVKLEVGKIVVLGLSSNMVTQYREHHLYHVVQSDLW